MKRSIRQHEVLRVPEGWEGQARALVIQLNRILDNLYTLVQKLEEKTEETDNGDNNE